MSWLIHAPTGAVVIVTVALMLGVAAAHLYNDSSYNDIRKVHGFIYVIFTLFVVAFGITAAFGEQTNRHALGVGALLLTAFAIVALFFAGYHTLRKQRHD